MQSFTIIISDSELYRNYLSRRALQQLYEMQSFTKLPEMQSFTTTFLDAELYAIISDTELYNNYLSRRALQQLYEMQSFTTII